MTTYWVGKPQDSNLVDQTPTTLHEGHELLAQSKSQVQGHGESKLSSPLPFQPSEKLPTHDSRQELEREGQPRTDEMNIAPISCCCDHAGHDADLDKDLVPLSRIAAKLAAPTPSEPSPE